MIVADHEAPGHFVFAHAIVREAVRDALPGPRRAALHEAVADALRVRRDAGADVSAARIAHHAIAAARIGADPQPAWDAALEAAREAASVLGHAEAARHYADALDSIALGAEAPAAVRRADVARARRRDVRRRRHRGGPPALLPGRGRGPPRARRGDARARRARLRAGLSVRRHRRREHDPADRGPRGAPRRPATGAGERPARRLRTGAGAARGADRRGAGDRARRGDARLAVSGGGDRELAPGAGGPARRRGGRGRARRGPARRPRDAGVGVPAPHPRCARGRRRSRAPTPTSIAPARSRSPPAGPTRAG